MAGLVPAGSSLVVLGHSLGGVVALTLAGDGFSVPVLGVIGLDGLVAAGDPAVDAGLVQRDGRWRLAVDPAAFAPGVPDMTRLVARSRGPVTLARGELDPMNTDEQLASLSPTAVTLAGLGHNAHVQDPGLCATLLSPYFS